MKSVEFGAYIKAERESKSIPQRIVAHALNVDTSTLSKMELGERQILIPMIEPISKALGIDHKDVQIRYIIEKIKSDFKGQLHLKEALQQLQEEL